MGHLQVRVIQGVNIISTFIADLNAVLAGHFGCICQFVFLLGTMLDRKRQKTSGDRWHQNIICQFTLPLPVIIDIYKLCVAQTRGSLFKLRYQLKAAVDPDLAKVLDHLIFFLNIDRRAGRSTKSSIQILRNGKTTAFSGKLAKVIEVPGEYPGYIFSFTSD